MKLNKILFNSLLAGIAAIWAVPANASFTLNYSVGGDDVWVGGDHVTLLPYNSGPVDLTADGSATIHLLNNVNWFATPLAPSGSYDAMVSRNMTISILGGGISNTHSRCFY